MKMQMTAATTPMTGRTTSLGHRHHEPSERALATRSWTGAQRLTGAERSAAIHEHFNRFGPVSPTCRS